MADTDDIDLADFDRTAKSMGGGGGMQTNGVRLNIPPLREGVKPRAGSITFGPAVLAEHTELVEAGFIEIWFGKGEKSNLMVIAPGSINDHYSSKLDIARYSLTEKGKRRTLDAILPKSCIEKLRQFGYEAGSHDVEKHWKKSGYLVLDHTSLVKMRSLKA